MKPGKPCLRKAGLLEPVKGPTPGLEMTGKSGLGLLATGKSCLAILVKGKYGLGMLTKYARGVTNFATVAKSQLPPASAMAAASLD